MTEEQKEVRLVQLKYILTEAEAHVEKTHPLSNVSGSEDFVSHRQIISIINKLHQLVGDMVLKKDVIILLMSLLNKRERCAPPPKETLLNSQVVKELDETLKQMKQKMF